MDDPKPLTADEFKRELEERGIFSQVAAAYRLGYSQSMISLYLSGKRPVPARMRVALQGIRRKRQPAGEEAELVSTSKDSGA